MGDIQSPTAENRRGQNRRKKEETTGLKHNGLPITMGGHKKVILLSSTSPHIQCGEK